MFMHVLIFFCSLFFKKDSQEGIQTIICKLNGDLYGDNYESTSILLDNTNVIVEEQTYKPMILKMAVYHNGLFLCVFFI